MYKVTFLDTDGITRFASFQKLEDAIKFIDNCIHNYDHIVSAQLSKNSSQLS